jgi:type II secretory pathway component GspD/PulD (secretin)
MITSLIRFNPLFRRSCLALCLTIALAAIGGARSRAASDSDLKVTGSPARMSLYADHADVTAALSRVLRLAHRDFTIEPSVGGIVTMRLSNRTWSTIVDAVCRQSFTKYSTVDGVLTFRADTAALREAVRRTREISDQLAEELQSHGYTRAPNWQQITPAAGAKAVKLPDWLAAIKAKISITASGEGGKPYPEADPRQNPQLYVQVDVFIPKDNPISVVDCLKQLAAQAKIPIEISPDVTQGYKFRIQGHISNHTFLDDVQILATTARLQWRIGQDGKLYISNAPPGLKTAPHAPAAPGGVQPTSDSGIKPARSDK